MGDGALAPDEVGKLVYSGPTKPQPRQSPQFTVGTGSRNSSGQIAVIPMEVFIGLSPLACQLLGGWAVSPAPWL